MERHGMDKSLKMKLALVIGILVLVGLFFLFDLGRYFSLSNLKGELDSLKTFYTANKALTITIYMAAFQHIDTDRARACLTVA